MSTIAKENPQTFWKRIKVPKSLQLAGWRLERNDTTAPFALTNAKLNLTTGGFPDPQEAINAAEAMEVERAEAEAIQTEGEAGESADRLPVKLIDEGWRLVSEGGQHHAVFRSEEATHNYVTAAEAVQAAIAIESERQRELEAREAGVLLPGVPAPTTTQLPLERIRLDGGTQQRTLFDDQVVSEYADLLQHGVAFPPIEVIAEGEQFWLVDGFYRVRAALKLGWSTFLANVKSGTQREAVLLSLGANSAHGQPRTPADKRRAVQVMLEDPEWSQWSDNYIAGCAHVSQTFVSKWRRELTAAGEVPTQTTRRGKDNRVQETKRIGTRQEDDQLEIPGSDQPTATDREFAMEVPPDDDDDIERQQHRSCTSCGGDITPAQYCNAAGECWDCDKKAKKKTKNAAPAELGKTKEGGRVFANVAAPVTVPELMTRGRQVESLVVSLYWTNTKTAAQLQVFVTVDEEIREHKLSAALQLPGALLDLIAADIDTPPGKKPKSKPTRKENVTSARKRKPPTTKQRTAGKRSSRPSPGKGSDQRRASETKGRAARPTKRPDKGSSKRPTGQRDRRTNTSKPGPGRKGNKRS